MLESVTSPEARYTVKHHAMLYAREIGLVNRKEYLLFSVEEDEQGNVTLTTAVGVTLQLPDLQVL
ncbi:YjfK family protein [Pseudomonas sp. KNUC1026]|nr:YjfK family protein [Pseudomonas sp. KNUC1026]